MKYNYKDYKAPLCDEMKDVEIAYKKYQEHKPDKKLYDDVRSCSYLNLVLLKKWMIIIGGYYYNYYLKFVWQSLKNCTFFM